MRVKIGEKECEVKFRFKGLLKAQKRFKEVKGLQEENINLVVASVGAFDLEAVAILLWGGLVHCGIEYEQVVDYLDTVDNLTDFVSELLEVFTKDVGIEKEVENFTKANAEGEG